MKLKERFGKQNNSIKQLLKKLKRHDTVVVAIAVLIALILCGGLIYLSTPVVASSVAEEYGEKDMEANEQTREKLDEIHEYLTELDKLVCDNKEGIDSICEDTRELREISSKETNNSETNNSETITSEIKSTITEKIIGLDKSVSEIHSSIEKTNDKITEVEKLIIAGDQDNKKLIAEGFDKISEDLSVIKQQYAQIQEDNRALTEELKKEINDGDAQINNNLTAKYNAIIDKLDKMNEDLQAKDKEAIDAFRGDIQALSSDIGGKITALNNNVDNKFGGLQETISGYNETVVNKIDSQNAKMDSDIGSLKSYMEEEIGSVNTKLDEVFQSVSKGKEQLASALLTKGVTVSEDASFYELSQAISSIDTTQMQGEIEYIRHYHVDGNGNKYEGEEVPADRHGGCFTVAKKHQHTSACYKKVTVYTYSTGTSVDNLGAAYTVNSEQYYNYRCNYCGSTFVNTNPSHAETTRDYSDIQKRNGQSVTSKQVTVSNCSLGNQADVYACSCGYLNGQIIEARIKYDSHKPTVRPADVLTPEDEEAAVVEAITDGEVISGNEAVLGETEAAGGEATRGSEDNSNENVQDAPGKTDGDSQVVTEAVATTFIHTEVGNDEKGPDGGENPQP